MERKSLGRGLSSLLGPAMPDEPSHRIIQAPVDEIRPNPHQPRHEWHDESLEELANSIRENGVLQPLIVRGRAGSYELVAGERRLRASKLARLTHVPVILRETDEEGSLRLALIENIQREDISPLDAATAYQQLIEQFEMTQEEVARAVGKSRPAVANALRLLRLPAPILESLRSRSITEGHARTLLSIADPDEQLRLLKLAEEGASVRELEAISRNAAGESRTGTAEARGRVELRTSVVRRGPLPPHLNSLVDRLRQALATRVDLKGDDETGVLSLEYYSTEHLEELVERLLAPVSPAPERSIGN